MHTQNWDILNEKRESEMALKMREFTPESGNVDTYEIISGIFRQVYLNFFHECVHSIIPHQHMQKLCIFIIIQILMQNNLKILGNVNDKK